MSSSTRAEPPTPRALARLLAPYPPGVRRLAAAARSFVLMRSGPVVEIVYDGYNAVAVAFSRSPRLKDAFCHLAVYTDHVNLGFNRGATLADPDRLLQGRGRAIRHIRLTAAKDLEAPAISSLVEQAAARHDGPPPEAMLLVKPSSGKKRRPRRGQGARRA